MKSFSILAILAGVIINCVNAQDTAFTYQGRLSDNGAPANGTKYSLVFYLYDAPSNGTLLGDEGIVSVTASNGLFTVPLDFTNVFDGNPRWLEVSVEKTGPGGDSGFTILSPRQQITPVPYAIFANTASNVTGTLSLTQLPTAIITNGASGANISGTFTGNGSGLMNLDASQLFGLVPVASIPDPLNLNQINAETLWATNALMPMNEFGGTVVDFNKGESITNLSGNLTFTDVSHVTEGAVNSAIVSLYSGDFTRFIRVPESWHTCTNWTGTLPAGWVMDVLVRVQPGLRTNVAQVIYP